jgi:hypothetical protein
MAVDMEQNPSPAEEETDVGEGLCQHRADCLSPIAAAE